MNNTSPYKPRAHVIERPDYRPAWPQEQFIVPLLQKHIVNALNTYASNPKPAARVIDIGCGRQPFRKDLEHLGYTYVGLDVKQNPEETVDFVAEIDADFLDSEPSLGTFDFVLCTEVLEHVAQWHLAFNNMYLLTAPGGKVLITCPHFYQLHEAPYDFWRPTNFVLEYYANQVGFKIVEQINAGDAWDVLGTSLANIHGFSMKSYKLKDKLLYRLVVLLHKKISKILVNRTIQNAVAVHSPLYLSNVLVLEK